ncbi:MAG: creatininase family protein [Candidatus Bathyarchaeia archaeon]
MVGKYRLWDMSWMEAEEAFGEAELVVLPVGTLHGHGPTPISIDSSSVEEIARRIGERTGVLTLPLLVYGENEKQKSYPGSITISPDTLEEVYLDVFRSIKRNGVDKVVVLNGHGGNREVLVRACLRAREFSMVVAILEWYRIGLDLVPELYEEAGGGFMMELALAMAIQGEDIADVRPGEGYKGEWGAPYTMRDVFGDEIEPQGFHSFKCKNAGIIIPIDAWDLDLEGPPKLTREDLGPLKKIGEEVLERVVNYTIDFIETFRGVEIDEALETTDEF